MRFFNSIYKNRSITFDTSLMKYILKETYFRDIYLFLKYARDVANIKNKKLVRINL